MQPSQHSISHVNHCRQLAQQLMQQTQESTHQYQQMLQNEQQNIQMLDSLLQKERMSVQSLQQSLQGHEMAIQRCQEVISECNRIEQELSGQYGMSGFQTHQYATPNYQVPVSPSGMQNMPFRQ